MSDDYDLSQYKEKDHEIVKMIESMTENDTIDLNLCHENGEAWTEKDGSPVVIDLGKVELDEVLKVAREDSTTFDEALGKIIREGIDGSLSKNV